MFVWGNGAQFSQINCSGSAYPHWRWSSFTWLPFQLSHAGWEGCLREDIQKDDWGNLRHKHPLGLLCWSQSPGKHLKVGHVFFCSHAWYHFKCMQLSTCHPFPIWVTEGPFDGCRSPLRCWIVEILGQGCAGLIGCPEMSHPSTHKWHTYRISSSHWWRCQSAWWTVCIKIGWTVFSFSRFHQRYMGRLLWISLSLASSRHLYLLRIIHAMAMQLGRLHGYIVQAFNIRVSGHCWVAWSCVTNWDWLWKKSHKNRPLGPSKSSIHLGVGCDIVVCL